MIRENYTDPNIERSEWPEIWHTESRASALPRKRAHIVLPDDLLAEVDSLVGPRGRSAFLTEVIRKEMRRRRLLQILSNPEPIWKGADHPELADGPEAWVRKLRDQDERSEQEKLGEWWRRSE